MGQVQDIAERQTHRPANETAQEARVRCGDSAGLDSYPRHRELHRVDAISVNNGGSLEDHHANSEVVTIRQRLPPKQLGPWGSRERQRVPKRTLRLHHGPYCLVHSSLVGLANRQAKAFGPLGVVDSVSSDSARRERDRGRDPHGPASWRENEASRRVPAALPPKLPHAHAASRPIDWPETQQARAVIHSVETWNSA